MSKGLLIGLGGISGTEILVSFYSVVLLSRAIELPLVPILYCYVIALDQVSRPFRLEVPDVRDSRGPL